jgi:hypothetical protein
VENKNSGRGSRGACQSRVELCENKSEEIAVIADNRIENSGVGSWSDDGGVECLAVER